MPDNEFDVVVIGSGIGGLSAARLFAEFGGKRVLVLEHHYTLGGMTHEFSREGRYHFGTGLHYLTAKPSPVLNYLADGRAQYHPLPDDYDILHFPGFDFAIPASEARFRERLKARFPEDAGAVDRFFTTVRRASQGLIVRHVVSSLAPMLRALSLPVVERLYPDTFRSIADVVARHFRDPALRAIVSARWGLFGPPPARSAFGFHALVALQSYMDGATHPVGGPRALSQAIIEALERRGVVLRARQHVRRILVEHGHAAGIEVEDRLRGERYTVAAPCVVSAVGARNTCDLLDPVSARPWERELEKLSGEIATVLLFLGLDQSPASLGLRGENHWFMPDLDDEAGLARPPGEGILYVSFGSLNNPAARAHTVEVMQFVDAGIFRQWFGTESGARPASYRTLKAKVTARLIDRLDARWPGFKANVAFAELATPLTFMTYQLSVHGAFYGLATSAERLRSPVARCRTNIKGLYLSGQDAWNPGIEAALWGGIMSATAALSGPQRRKMWASIRSPHAVLDAPAQWRGHLRVSNVEVLTPSVKRIRFEPLRGGALPFEFKAGQYIKLDVPIAGEAIERAYSISSGPGERRFIEISVKRDAHGLGSSFLHDRLKAGEALRLSAPFGEFTVDVTRNLGTGRLLLIAGGVGMTPILSVLAAAADLGWSGPISLLASFRSEADVLFEREVEEFTQRLPGLQVMVHVTQASAAWRGRRGRIEIETLRPHVADVRRVHLCGPAAMMQALIAVLTELDVPRDAIHTEAFVSSRSRQTLREKARVVEMDAARVGTARFRVFRRNERTFVCTPGQTILAAANAAHVPFKQSCGGEGSCGTCRVRVLSGTFQTDAVAMFSSEETGEGWVLSCQTLPTDDLEIADWAEIT